MLKKKKPKGALACKSVTQNGCFVCHGSGAFFLFLQRETHLQPASAARPGTPHQEQEQEQQRLDRVAKHRVPKGHRWETINGWGGAEVPL